MGRAPCCDKANVKRGPWSPEEDEILKSYIEQHGTGGNWISLPSKAGLRRCGKSCRLRWLNYLRPDIKHGKFTEEEDRVIFSLYSEIGSRWSIIAAKLHGRTDNDVKNHWNTKLKKLLKNGVAEIFSSSAAHSYSVSSDHERCSFAKFPNMKTETHQESLSAMPNLLPAYASSLTFAHHDPGCFVVPTDLIKPNYASNTPSSADSNTSSFNAGNPSWADRGGNGLDESGFLIDILNYGEGMNYGCHLFQSSFDNADQSSDGTASMPNFSATVSDYIYDFKPQGVYQSGLIDQH